MSYSDSESEAGDSVISTNVLLGYAEEEPIEDAVSRLGGKASWLHPNSPLDSRLAKCQNCNRLMSLLLQLNGAIPESPHERMFYVYACKEKTCRRKKGAVRAIRGVRTSETATQEETPKPVGEEKKEVVQAGNFLFGSAPAISSGSNPFSTPGAAPINPFSTSSNPFATSTPAPAPVEKPKAESQKLSKTFAETLKISASSLEPTPAEPQFYGPAEPWPDPLPHAYPMYYLDAEYEVLENKAPEVPQNVEISEDVGGDDLPMSGTAFENSLDKTFQKFADRVGQNSEQVLRYEYRGTPLLYSKDDEVGKILLDNTGEYTNRKIPACGNCARPGRVFEFQLMPHAITMLEGDEMGLDGMEWGTIMVGTCTCVPRFLDANRVGYVEEWVGVQWEQQK
ncbi:hypothetical protein RUND412_000756 [Rhizina undulata]